MIQRLLRSRNFLACLLASATGLALYFQLPFPQENPYLELVELWARPVFLGFKYFYILFLYTTPYIGYSIVLSGIYIFTFKGPDKQRPGRLPLYPDPSSREDLYLVVGEVHNARTPGPSEAPRWLVVPEKGLFTGIAIFGAIGSGKTSCCILPFAEQLLAYRATEADKKIGGLVLEVKGDFCHKMKAILTRNSREHDYIEVSLASPYRYNPLHNDLDAYALAYSIASLMTNLFGRGKEPFWQQASTNVVKFVILLHQTLDDYVTLFQVYELVINPDKLRAKIAEGERRFAPDAGPG